MPSERHGFCDLVVLAADRCFDSSLLLGWFEFSLEVENKKFFPQKSIIYWNKSKREVNEYLNGKSAYSHTQTPHSYLHK